MWDNVGCCGGGMCAYVSWLSKLINRPIQARQRFTDTTHISQTPQTKVGILNARDVRRLITGLDSESARSKEMSVAVRFVKRGLICVCTYALSSVIRAHPIHRSVHPTP